MQPRAESSFEIGAAQPLFAALTTPRPRSFDAFADGQRFLINIVSAQEVAAPITVLVNRTAELKK